jgi:hypothetical protein
MKISEVTKFTEVTYDNILYEHKKSFREIVSEIRYGHFGTAISPETVLDGEELGTYEGQKIFGTKMVEGGKEFIVIYVPDGNSYKGYVKCIDNGNSVEFSQAFVKDEFRRKGILSSIILYTLRTEKTRITISPDEIVTDDSRSLFYNLSAVKKMITIRDSRTGKVMDSSELGKLFSDLSDNNVGLIVESEKRINEHMTQIININNGKSEFN